MRKIILSCAVLVVFFSWASGQNPAGHQKTGNVTVPSEENRQYTFKGYYNITEMGVLAGSNENEYNAPFSFLTVNGYHLTNKLALGVGVGVEFMAESYMPVMLDVRYYLRDKNFSPFVFVQGGYSFALDDDAEEKIRYDFYDIWPYPTSEYPVKAKGGWVFNPGVGIRSMFSQNFGLLFSVGYRLQQFNYDSDENRELQVDYNRLSIKLGIIFR